MDVNIEKWHSVKLEKYQVDIQQEADKEWSIYVYPIEVDARGFVRNRRSIKSIRLEILIEAV